MAKTNYCVYVHINKQNRKCYVGITKDIRARWGPNGSHYNRAHIFGRAIEKYGWDNFEHIIIENNITFKEAKILEQLYIKELDAKVPNGYNLTDGGEGTVGFKLSEEAKKRIGIKMSEIRKGCEFSEEHKKNLSKAKVEYIKRAKENGIQLPAKRKPVLQFDKNGNFIKRYESAIDAYRETKICQIYGACDGVRKTAGGYIWKWEEDYNGAY